MIVERCQEHMVADGEIERSIKKDGLVERTRRCAMCGSLFKTFESTDDQLAKQEVEHEMEIRDLKRELDYYVGVVGKTKDLYQAEKDLREELISEYDYGSEDRD